MLTPQECSQVYDQLVEMLHEAGMEWVNEQVAETILLGKSQPKKVRTFREPSTNERLPARYNTTSNYLTASENKRRLTGPEVDLTATREYTPQEQLTLLINAIEQAIVETAEMEQITVRNLEAAAQNQQTSGVVFVSEQNNQSQLSLSMEAATQRSNAGRELRHLLRVLKDDIYAH